MRTFQLLYAAPIPVGHRVELVWYRRRFALTGFQSEPLSQPHEPLIHDIDTGVRYAPHWMYTELESPRADRPVSLRSDVREDIQREFQIIGRVLACRIVAFGPRQQTVLNIEPEEERGAYR